MLTAIVLLVSVFFITCTYLLFRVISLLTDIKETKLVYERIVNDEKWV
jgi:hypothetical protein